MSTRSNMLSWKSVCPMWPDSISPPAWQILTPWSKKAIKPLSKWSEKRSNPVACRLSNSRHRQYIRANITEGESLMSNIESIAKRACTLLGKSPAGAAVGIQLEGGLKSFVDPEIPGFGMGALLIGSGMLRSSEARPDYDLRVQLEERQGQYRASLERITGMAALATIPDPSEYLGHLETATLEEAEA